MLQPKYIIEIGTFNGFSTLCLAEGLANGGHLDTIELREEDAQRAQTYFTQYGQGKSIQQHMIKEIKAQREWKSEKGNIQD